MEPSPFWPRHEDNLQEYVDSNNPYALYEAIETLAWIVAHLEKRISEVADRIEKLADRVTVTEYRT